MKAIATKQPTNESVKQNKSGEKGRSRSISPLSIGISLLQRKCACGGGCPRCKKSPIQTKLKISEPGDKYEQEADRVADEVMRMPEPSVQRQSKLDELVANELNINELDIGEEEEEEEDGDDAEDGDTEVLGLVESSEEEPHGPEPISVSEELTLYRQADLPNSKLQTGKKTITQIEVDQAAQSMTVFFSDGSKVSHNVSTGRGRPNTKDDPCKTQTEKNCTPNGTFTVTSKGDANTKNSHNDRMSWYVGFIDKRGIGIHDSQPVSGSPRSHGCVRVGSTSADDLFAKTINERAVIGKTKIIISGKAKTKPWKKSSKKKKKP